MKAMPLVNATTISAGNERKQKARYNLTLRDGMWLGLMMILPLAVAMFVVLDQGRMQREVLHRSVEQELDQSQAAFGSRETQMQILGDRLIAQEAFNALVRTRDQKGLGEFLTVITGADDSLHLLVWDMRKDLLAQSSNNTLAPLGGQPAPQSLEAALSGRQSVTMELDGSGRASRILTLPIRDLRSGEITGALSVGFFLDDGFLNSIPRINSDQEMIVIAGEQIVAGRLDQAAADSLLAKLSAEDSIRAERKGTRTDFFTVETLGRAYEFKFVPLSGAGDLQPVWFGIGTPIATFSENAVNWPGSSLFPFLIVAMGVGVGGAFYLFGNKSGWQELLEAIKTMSRGNFSSPVSVNRSGEIGTLAKELEQARQRWMSEIQQGKSREINYENVINSMAIAAIETSLSREIMWVNPAAEALLRETKAELVGKQWDSLFAEGESGFDSPAMPREHDPARPLKGNGSRIQISNRLTVHKSPHPRLTVISSPILLGDRITGFVHVLLDTTSEDEFIRSRDQFMMHAAHELRAPLAKYKIAIELLTEAFQQKDWELLRSLLGNMGRTTAYFQFFVENLIDVGNVQAGYFRVRPYQTEFKKIVHTALDQIQPFVPTEGKEIELRQNLPDPCMVVADPPRVAQVIFNLLSNAIKYGGEGKPILFSTFVSEGQAIVEVTDYGAGIAPEEINLIFTRFYRGKRVENEGMGIGLGLAIAREIIEQHGGKIHAHSRMGEGTTVRFSIPLAS